MMRILSKSLLLLIAGFAACCYTVAADTGADQEFYVNTFRSIGTVKGNSSRSRAMGGAGRGLADGVASVGVNPAALGAFTDRGYEVGVGYDWLDDGASDANQYSFRLGGAISLESIRPTGGCNQALGGLLQTENFSGAGDIGMKKKPDFHHRRLRPACASRPAGRRKRVLDRRKLEIAAADRQYRQPGQGIPWRRIQGRRLVPGG